LRNLVFIFLMFSIDIDELIILTIGEIQDTYCEKARSVSPKDFSYPKHGCTMWSTGRGIRVVKRNAPFWPSTWSSSGAYC
jgi:hypothetical protein